MTLVDQILQLFETGYYKKVLIQLEDLEKNGHVLKLSEREKLEGFCYKAGSLGWLS